MCISETIVFALLRHSSVYRKCRQAGVPFALLTANSSVYEIKTLLMAVRLEAL